MAGPAGWCRIRQNRNESRGGFDWACYRIHRRSRRKLPCRETRLANGKSALRTHKRHAGEFGEEARPGATWSLQGRTIERIGRATDVIVNTSLYRMLLQEKRWIADLPGEPWSCYSIRRSVTR